LEVSREIEVRRLVASRRLVVLGACLQVALATHAADRFEVSNYGDVKRIVEVALSADETRVAYRVATDSIAENRTRYKVYILRMAPNERPEEIEALSGARELTWTSSNRRLAFLSDVTGIPEVFSYQPEVRTVRQETTSSTPIVAFTYSPDGMTLAYISRKPPSPDAALYTRLANGTHGVTLDPDTANITALIDPGLQGHAAGAATFPGILWLQSATADPTAIPVPGDVSAISWSPSAQTLAVTYTPAARSGGFFVTRPSSVGLFDRVQGKFRVFAEASGPRTDAETSYATGEWMRTDETVVVLRFIDRDPWYSYLIPDWCLGRVSTDFDPDHCQWHATESFTATRNNQHLWPVDERTVRAEAALQGRVSFYQLSDTSPRSLISLEGSSSQVSLSADGQTVAFVNEDLNRLPELYVQRNTERPRQLTHLNDSLQSLLSYHTREVNWHSSDGVAIHGWLLEPADGHKPWPLITFVHGGPVSPMTNSFAQYWATWPCPLEVYATHGMAVFIPNYRGTLGYGRQFVPNTDLASAPVADLLSGVQFLVDAGIADPARLGAAGHSHGGWLGPLLIERSRGFRAASFAEGWANNVLMYLQGSAERNREVHDRVEGVGFYTDPLHYLENSPDRNLEGLHTPILFEFGIHSGALQALVFAKATHFFGVPSETVLYPDTAHNLRLPALAAESAQRNVDWFRFWLQDIERSDASVEEQYRRWRALKQQRESSLRR
jgi:dienelactone hydrolase